MQRTRNYHTGLKSFSIFFYTEFRFGADWVRVVCLVEHETLGSIKFYWRRHCAGNHETDPGIHGCLGLASGVSESRSPQPPWHLVGVFVCLFVPLFMCVHLCGLLVFPFSTHSLKLLYMALCILVQRLAGLHSQLSVAATYVGHLYYALIFSSLLFLIYSSDFCFLLLVEIYFLSFVNWKRCSNTFSEFVEVEDS